MYRLGVGLLLINNQGQVFVAKRVQNSTNNSAQISHPWQMPQGGIDENEDEEIALYREMQEEIGLTENDVKIIHKANDYYYYDIPPEIAKTFWGGKYKGQRQRWFCCLLKSEESKININTTHPEFEAWKWISPYSITSICVDFKKPMYYKIFDDFFNVIQIKTHS